ncbi:hypothetical protein DY000_02039199 [Brassica cretica]|uniref:Uncharacterized protein n=1 Tax=Brassica cretica TaxID=69181 RepID=A0ABQ7BBD1_BRACR|nr:hypothetical protein DY000_02039199 [Brassica cretica]
MNENLLTRAGCKWPRSYFCIDEKPRCAEKLYYKRRKDAERSESKEKKRQKRKRNRSSSEDDIEEEERRKGKKNKSKLEGCEREGKDDENFDEFMEGMFPGKGDN